MWNGNGEKQSHQRHTNFIDKFYANFKLHSQLVQCIWFFFFSFLLIGQNKATPHRISLYSIYFAACINKYADMTSLSFVRQMHRTAEQKQKKKNATKIKNC